MNQKKYLITASLLNSWHYAISPDNEYGNLEDFKKVLSKEPMEITEAIQNGFDFEKYMTENYEPTKRGCYQVKLSKNITTNTGNYVLYGILDCLKAGTIYDYKYKGSYEVGSFFSSYQHLMYFEICPESDKFTYLITNNYKKGKTLEDINLYQETYLKEDMTLNLYQEIDNFIAWLKTNDLYNLFCQYWESKY